MNGTGIERYSNNWEKLSKKLRLLYPCVICGENDFTLKECHHIDGNKRNSAKENVVVLCIECHASVHDGSKSLPKDKNCKISSGISVRVARPASSRKEWFDSTLPLKIIPGLKPELANQFRRENVKGFIKIGGCNYYIGLEHAGFLIGVLGFCNPDHGSFSVFLKADTTPSEWENSTDLLLYVLRTIQVQEALERKFNRKITTAYSMCFSQHNQINRYRKHAELIKKQPIIEGGFKLGYLFNLGNIKTLKEAKAMWMQKHFTK